MQFLAFCSEKKDRQRNSFRWPVIGVLLTVLLTGIILLGCSNERQTDQKVAVFDETSQPKEMLQSEPVTQPKNETFQTSDIMALESFSDGYAWVKVRRESSDTVMEIKTSDLDIPEYK